MTFTSLADLASETTADVFAEFLNIQVSENSRRAYAKSTKDFFESLGKEVTTTTIKEFLQLTQPQAIALVLQYRSNLLAANLSPNTINLRIAALKSLVRYARKVGQTTVILDDIKNLRAEVYRDTTGIGAEDYRLIVNQIDRQKFGGKRDYAIMRLLWDNAIRCGELVATNVQDFDAVNGQLWIVSKGRTQKQSIDLSPATVAAVAHWVAARGEVAGDDPLFVGVGNRSWGQRLSGGAVARLVNELSQQAQIPKRMSPNRVRHSSITAYLDASGGNVRAAQGLSRHTNLNTLSRYDDNRQRYQAQASDILADLI